MNKKIIVVILLIFMIVSVVAIPYLEALKPFFDPPRIENIVFVDEENNEVSYMEINIKDLKPNEEGKYIVEFQLNYRITPIDSIDKDLLFAVNVSSTENNKLLEIVSISDSGYVVVELDSPVTLTIPIVLTCKDKDSLFYSKTANIDVKLIANTGGNVDL